MLHHGFTHLTRIGQDLVVSTISLVGAYTVSAVHAQEIMDLITPFMAIFMALGGGFLMILRCTIAIWELRQRMHERKERKRAQQEADTEDVLEEDGKPED